MHYIAGMEMTLTINGEAQRFLGPMTVAELIAQMSLDTRKVAIERNLAIVPRSQHVSAQLNDGDVIEIVEFIGGG